MKLYSEGTEAQKRYSSAERVGACKEAITGNPDPEHISTSFAERADLTMRRGMRRCTRFTNAFSKAAENHAHSIAIHFMHYNFVRMDQTLRISPAMAAAVTDRLREPADMVAMIDAAAPKRGKPGSYWKGQENVPA